MQQLSLLSLKSQSIFRGAANIHEKARTGKPSYSLGKYDVCRLQQASFGEIRFHCCNVKIQVEASPIFVSHSTSQWNCV